MRPSKSEFIKLSKKGNLIPVYKEIPTGNETPASAYKKIEGEYSFLLESIEGGEKIARYSFLGSNPILIFSSKGNEIKIVESRKQSTEHGNPFDSLKKLFNRYKLVRNPNLPRFHGGLVGYIGYDAVRFIEKIPDKNPDTLKLPDMQFVLTDTILAFDHKEKKILIISNAYVEDNPERAYEGAVAKIEKIEEKLKGPTVKLSVPRTAPMSIGAGSEFNSNFTKQEYEKLVLRAKEYIKAGDIIQVVPSQRIEIPFTSSPFKVYQSLRKINPSPYMYYLKFGKLYIVGSSPEIMVRLEKETATVRPIAGTRRRGKTEEEDKALEKELLADPKEKAEHIMLVDLGRNDLGRVCKPGSVKVDEMMTIERYSHVMHIVSNVSGKIRKDKDAFDLLKASFPAGTVSGAPKIRAMEIIDELENVKRGPYAGCVGYFCFSGDLDTCITIRTIIIKDGKAYVQAGGGVVADSIPEREYQETLNKAKGMLKAIELV